MRLLNIWVKLLSTTIQVAFIQLQLLNQRILFRLDEWFKTDKKPVSPKTISAFDEFEEQILDIEEEFSDALNTSDTQDKPDKPYKPYDGPVSMTP